MKDKLEYLCEMTGHNASSLAKLIGVEASAISHIKSNRNKPSLDFMVKILQAFPEINPDWLLLDSDQFYRNEAAAPHSPTGREDGVSEVVPSLFAAPLDVKEKSDPQESNVEQKNISDAIFPVTSNPSKQVERIIVLYTDKSFDSYTPQSR